MEEKEKEALEESIQHWERMIKWVKTRHRLDRVSIFAMDFAIKENWGGAYCALCKINETCGTCILSKKYGNCSGSKGVKNVWDEVRKVAVRDGNWGEWLKSAEKMLKQLKSLK